VRIAVSLAACVSMLVGIDRGGARGQDAGHARLPLAARGGWDTPLGAGGLSLALESQRGWGAGLGVGLSDARPGTLHQHLSLFTRAPLLRIGAVELSGSLYGSRASRERERRRPGVDLLRWEWRPAYRLDVALAARLRRGAWAVGLEAGLGWVLNHPRCQLIADIYLDSVDCADPRIPADQRATEAPGRLAPSLALALEYDLLADGPREEVTESVQLPAARRRDARESNAWLAPTALTLPAGDVRFTAYELLFAELAWGVTDQLQASVGLGWVPPENGIEILWRFEVKYRLPLAGRLRLALLGFGFGYTGEHSTDGRLTGAGAVASLCLDDSCQSLLSLAGHAGVGLQDPDEGGTSRISDLLLSPSLVVAIGSRVKLVAEVTSGGSLIQKSLAFALIRLPFDHLTIEVGTIIEFDGVTFFPVGSVGWRF
jgi:hypothetical protein